MKLLHKKSQISAKELTTLLSYLFKALVGFLRAFLGGEGLLLTFEDCCNVIDAAFQNNTF